MHGQHFEFLLDTGAAYTAVSREIADLLDLKTYPDLTLLIAPAQGQTIRVPVATLADLSVGGMHLSNVRVVILEFPDRLKLDGLLGMNVLRNFRFTIEPDTATLVTRNL